MKFLDCVKNELDLANPLPVDSANIDGWWSWYIAEGLDKNQNEIIINVPDSLHYLDFTSCLLYVKLKIYNTELGLKTDLTDSNCAIAPVNNFLYSLFKQQIIELNGTIVENTSNFAHKAHILNLLNYNNDAKNTNLLATLFTHDTASEMENINTSTIKQETQANSASTSVSQPVNQGFIKRRSILLDGKGRIEMVGSLMSDLFNSERLLLDKMNIRIKLFKNDEAFCLMGPTLNKFKIDIEEVKLRVRNQQISTSVLMSHNRLLMNSNAIYPIKDTCVKIIKISNSSLKVTEIISKGILPEKIIIGFVESLSVSGKSEKNPFNYQHFFIKEIKLKINNFEKPYLDSLKFDFQNNLFLNGYMTIFDVLDKHDLGISITPKDYCNGYFLTAFNLLPITSCGGDYRSILSSGQVTVDLEFHQKSLDDFPKADIDMVCLLVYDSKIEVNSERKIQKLNIIP